MWDSKRHRCKEQTFGLCGRRQEWDDLREQHWNIYIIICEIDHQSRFNAWDRVLRAGALRWSWGMGWGGRWMGGSGWGTHVHPWLIHVNVWQKPLQYCKVISFQLKKKDAVLYSRRSVRGIKIFTSMQTFLHWAPGMCQDFWRRKTAHWMYPKTYFLCVKKDIPHNLLTTFQSFLLT